jgi:hypothetical protein
MPLLPLEIKALTIIKDYQIRRIAIVKIGKHISTRLYPNRVILAF